MANDDIRGTVTDGETLVEGAVVEVTKAQLDGLPSDGTVIRTTTDANGDYVVDWHPEGDGTSKDWVVQAYNFDSSSGWKRVSNAPGVTAALSNVPSAVETLYEFEDDTDTTTALDSQGNNNLPLSGGTYTTTSAVGSFGLDVSGVDSLNSESTVDLFNKASSQSFSIMGWANLSSTGTNNAAVKWIQDGDNYLQIYEISGGNWRALAQINGDVELIDGPSTTTGEYRHHYAELTQSELIYKVDGETVGTTSHSYDMSNLGAGNLRIEGVDGIVDDAAFAARGLTDVELDSILQRGGD